MSKGGKKGKGKKSKQTDEERLLQEKIRRMMEQDYQKQLALMARNELKSKMELENKNSKMNRLKIQNQWRKVMRLAKVETLRKEIEILSQNHERDVDRKDAIIQVEHNILFSELNIDNVHMCVSLVFMYFT